MPKFIVEVESYDFYYPSEDDNTPGVTIPQEKNAIHEALRDYGFESISVKELITIEEQELLKSYQEEIEKCFQIAQKLDSLKPELKGAFTGTPSERIERQLNALDIFETASQNDE